jgi:hypothetical protein
MKEFHSLIIEQTPKTPQIDLNQLTGDLIFSGKSIPENAEKVYNPILNWLKEYIHKARPITNLRLDLEYFNTASAIWLGKIINILIGINEPDYVLIIHLYLSIEDFNEINEFDDIKDVFTPIAGIDQCDINSIGIKLYGMDENGVIIKRTLVYIEQKQFIN